MSASRARRLRRAVVRSVLALTALSLLVYVPYRYAVRAPELEGFLGTGYALLFPLSAVLAVATLAAVWRPDLLRRLDGSTGWRAALGLYGGGWVLMGLMCLPSLTSLAAVSPVKGLFSTVHMSAQHVLLGFGAVAVAVDPGTARGILEGLSFGDARQRDPGTAGGSVGASGP